MVTVTFSHQGELDSNVSDELVGTAAAAAAAPAAEARIRAAIARNTFHSFGPPLRRHHCRRHLPAQTPEWEFVSAPSNFVVPHSRQATWRRQTARKRSSGPEEMEEGLIRPSAARRPEKIARGLLHK